MRVVMIIILAACLGGCDLLEETTEYCDDACTIWSETVDVVETTDTEGNPATEEFPCWEFDFCMDECEADGDWDKGYLECLQEAGDSCAELEACG